MLARSDQGRLALRREPVQAHDLLAGVARRFGQDVDAEGGGGIELVGDQIRLEQALKTSSTTPCATAARRYG